MLFFPRNSLPDSVNLRRMTSTATTPDELALGFLRHDNGRVIAVTCVCEHMRERETERERETLQTNEDPLRVSEARF